MHSLHRTLESMWTMKRLDQNASAAEAALGLALRDCVPASGRLDALVPRMSAPPTRPE
jgi:hypothetical protein